MCAPTLLRMVTLKDAAGDADVHIGAAVDPEALRTNTDYREALRNEFNALTAENAMKWGRLAEEEGAYDFSNADDIANFGAANDMYVRGHTLVWHRMFPQWLRPWDHTPEQIEKTMREHVYTVAGRYNGRVDAWDVVNEAVSDEGGLRENQWYNALGEEYLDKAFEYADDVCDADLFYNDYGADGMNEKSDDVYELVEGMVSRDVPIDGVGLQMHVFGEKTDPDEVAENVERLTDLGLDVHLTELDVGIGAAVEDEDEQTEYYRELVSKAVDAGVSTIITWGLNDGQSWLPARGHGEAPLLFNDEFDRKPAGDAVVEAFQEQ